MKITPEKLAHARSFAEFGDRTWEDAFLKAIRDLCSWARNIELLSLT